MRKTLIMTALLVGAISAQADVTANFTGSTAVAGFDATAGAADSTAANLDAGTTGGTWSGISSTGADAVPTVAVVTDFRSAPGNALYIGRFGNDLTAVSTATLTFDTAQTLAGTTVSFDGTMNYDGSQSGQMFITLMNGATAVARIGLSNDAQSGAGTVSHYSTSDQGSAAVEADFFKDQTVLGSIFDVWKTDNTTQANVQLNLGALDYGVSTTGADVSNLGVTGLSYVNGATTFDSMIFSAEGSKASWGIDNINVIPEPATLGMVVAFGGGLLFIRRMFAM